MTATDTATEIVADVAEEVSDGALHVADVSRGLSGRSLGLAAGAFCVGAGISGGLAYIFTKRRLETKYARIADEDIAEMRKHYQAKVVAAESQAQKLAPVKDIVVERGYGSAEVQSASPPMAIQPPKAVVDADRAVDPDDDSAMAEDEVEGPEGVKIPPRPVNQNIFEEAKITHEWNWHEERRRRSPDTPYVIHYDERHELDYESLTLTYYTEDDVLCNERDEIIDPEGRDDMIGEKNLERFGHGSNDASIVYVRNDKLELIFELVKSPNSYSEEVHGISHGAYDRGNLERMRARERDAPYDE